MVRDTGRRKGNEMFNTDGFINAEVAYREERLRKEWVTFGRSRAVRRAVRRAARDAR